MAFPFVGIDDFALKKRFDYGTLFIDLETNQPIDLIPSRSSESVMEWIASHPEICLITRDGSQAYAKGVRDASSDIRQAADRWHILKQLFEATKKTIYAHIPKVWNPPNPKNDETEPNLKPTMEIIQQEADDPIWSRIQQSKRLYAEGVKIAQIARVLGVVRNTVYADLRRPDTPIYRKAFRHKRYHGLILSLMEAGYDNPHIQEVCQQNGFKGELDELLTMIIAARNRSARAKSKGLSLRRKAVQILWGPPDEDIYSALNTLHPDVTASFPILEKLSLLIRSFRQLVEDHASSRLKKWITNYDDFESTYLQAFITGLQKDMAAVKLGIRLSWSNGPTEGNINRLKMIKRIMYNRAGFKLLRVRVIARSVL